MNVVDLWIRSPKIRNELYCTDQLPKLQQSPVLLWLQTQLSKCPSLCTIRFGRLNERQEIYVELSLFCWPPQCPSSALLSTTRGPTAMAAADYALPSCCDSAPPSTPLSPLFLHSPPSHSPFPSPKSKSNLSLLVSASKFQSASSILRISPPAPVSRSPQSSWPPTPQNHFLHPFPVFTRTPALP